MKQITFPIYLHYDPIPDDMHDAAFDRPGIHLAPHFDENFEGYMRFVFAWKDGSKLTDPYQIPPRVWEKLEPLLMDVA